jgi:hypothetical protein
MLSEQLATLERAAEPYLNSGYRVFSQTDSSLTLMRERRRFSIIALIVLLIVFWPAAIIYSVVNRSRRDNVVCLRITSQGYIEETGDTLKTADGPLSLKTVILMVLAGFAAAMLFIVLVWH